jgi:hypothetical protein
LELESEKLEEASVFVEKNHAKGADYINDALVSSGLSCS